MPSQTFHFTRPGSPVLEQESLPTYAPVDVTPAPTLAVPQKAPFARLQSRRLSTIIEVDEELPARPAGADSRTMIPQSLLVDASTTLCAYLYFTSLQARMTLQAQHSSDVIGFLCTSLLNGQDSAAGETTRAMCDSISATTLESARFHAAQILSSHKLIVAIVALKALFGYGLLRFAPKYIRPFDYLVASGAAHCLLLYFCFFVPVANVIAGSSGQLSELWPVVVSKLFWLLVLCGCFTFMHWIVTTASAARTRTTQEGENLDEKAIQLP